MLNNLCVYNFELYRGLLIFMEMRLVFLLYKLFVNGWFQKDFRSELQ